MQKELGGPQEGRGGDGRGLSEGREGKGSLDGKGRGRHPQEETAARKGP